MTVLTIFNEINTQTITLIGLTDSTGAKVTTATLTGTLKSSAGTTLATLTFAATTTPGSYAAVLTDFDGPTGPGELKLNGMVAGSAFNPSVEVYIKKWLL